MDTKVDKLTTEVKDILESGQETMNGVRDNINQVKDLVNSADNFLKTVKGIKEIDNNIANIESCERIELSKIAQKFSLCRDVLLMTFGERAKGLSKNYEALDKALESNDRELIIESLRGISNIVTKDPLENFDNFSRIMDDDDEVLELDF